MNEAGIQLIVIFASVVAFITGGAYLSDKPIKRLPYILLLTPLLILSSILNTLADVTPPLLITAVSGPILIALGYIVGGRLRDIGWSKGHALWLIFPFSAVFFAFPKSRGP